MRRPYTLRATFCFVACFLFSSAAFANEPQSYDQRLKAAGEWELLFEDGITTVEYARQLDFFAIELGALAKDGQIQYASRLSYPKPEKRTGQKELEIRYTTGWKRGTLAAADRKLLNRAGISTQDKSVYHFYPSAVTKTWYELENSYAKKDAGQITLTRFRIRPKPNGEKGYEFFVDLQEYKSPSPQSPSK